MVPPSNSLCRPGIHGGLTIRPTQVETEILVVDDNPADVDLTRDILGQCSKNFHVTWAKDGVEALALLNHENAPANVPVPDLLILDLNLPRKDGRAVLKQLKSDPRLSKIPVVVFTTSEANSDVTRSYELGANCYLRKPGNLADYRAIVQSMADFWLGLVSLPQKEKR